MSNQSTQSPTDTARSFEIARRHHLAGRSKLAEPIYRQILSEDPAHGDSLHALAILALQAGDHQAALDSARRAVTVNPTQWRYRCTLGQSLTALSLMDEALAEYRRAAAIQPDSVEAFYGMGVALQALGNRQEAISAYHRAISLQADHIEAHNNLGNVYHALGLLPQAIEAYQKALSFRPNYIEAQNNLASALQSSGQVNEAIAVFRQALAARPDFIPLYNNLANALRIARQYDEALSLLRQAIALKPDFAQAWYNLGNTLRDNNQFAQAADAYRQAISLSPTYWEAQNNLGNVLQTLGDFKEAVQVYLAALGNRPDSVDAYTNAGAALEKMGQVDQAIVLLKQAIFLKPDSHIAHCNLGNLLKDAGQLDEATASYRRAVELSRNASITHSNLVYTVHYHPQFDGPAILHENLRWNVMHAQALTRQALPHNNDRSPHRRLKIGYVSPDFRDHCQSMFTIPLLSHHDHEHFEVFCYGNISRPDAVTERIASYADVWRGTAGLGDEQVAALVREDRIDILIDLTMHMSHGRPLLFARRPAPIQVAWLAYPGTTGLSAMDYRLTDPYLDPPGETDSFYSERSVRLPDSFWCYDPLTTEPSPGPLPALTNSHITFGSLNNFCKVTTVTVELWASVMRGLANSRLLLLAPPGKHRQRLLDQFAELGIASDRVEFVSFQPRPAYLQTYRRIDLVLDTFPYNGHTTALDALWMGVPIATFAGRTAVGRAGFSLLSNLGLTELAGGSEADFLTIAVTLARDLPRLADLRSTLRQRLLSSPLCDGARFARNIENAYRGMWQSWCAAPTA